MKTHLNCRISLTTLSWEFNTQQLGVGQATTHSPITNKKKLTFATQKDLLVGFTVTRPHL